MAENIVLNNVVTFTNDTSAVNLVNGNNATITSAFTDVLSRSGVSPNQMNSPLDMNNNQIINLPAPSSINSPVRLVDISGNLGGITVPPTGTSGATVGFLNGNNTYSGISTFTNTINWTPVSGVSTFLTETLTATGTQTSGTSLFGTNDYGLNLIQVTSDNVARPSSGANKFGAMLITHQCGGTTMIGGRNSFSVLGVLQSASAAANNDRNYVAGNFSFQANAADGGTGLSPGTALGAVFALGGAAILAGSATNMLNVAYMEANVAVTNTATVYAKTAIQISSLPQDATHGTGVDAMICLTAQAGSIGWLNGIQFNNLSGQQPMASSGTLISTSGSSTVTGGINFTSYTFTGNSIAVPGFSVAGNGQGLFASTNSTQLFVNQTSGQFSQIAFQNAGTSKFAVTWDNTNLFATYNIPTVAGLHVFGNVNGNQLVIGATGLVQLGSGGVGASWTANGAGGAVTISASTPAAITTPATIFKWLTFLDNLGNAVYVPCWH